MIHYHGTPLTPRSELLKLAGKNFCCSFANPQDTDWCLGHGQSVMLDSGAFTAHKQAKPVAWVDYFRWLEPRLGHPHWAVIPDRIDGTVEEQRALVASWPFGHLGAPVWHMALPVSYLLDLVNHWPRVCFGSSGQYWQVGSEAWTRRCDHAFNELERRGLRPWVHMMRGMMLAGDHWPFASTDSANVARNFKDYATCPERMARRLDAIQSPARWTMVAEQKEMLV
jgi:hypothetical protein